MKPRQRKPQKQSARLYARGNDHRDIIYYDETEQKYIYHNALYWTEQNQAEVKKENIAWIKYAKNALMYYKSGGSSAAGFGWMDADRQFSYGVPTELGNQTYNFFGLECGITIFSMTRGTSGVVYVTEDGFVWQKIELDANTVKYFNTSLYLFGNDGVCHETHSSGTQGTFTFYVATFSKDEETGEWSFEGHTYAFITSYQFNGIFFVCNTEQGCILCHRYYAYDESGTFAANNVQYVHIDHAGVMTDKEYILSTAAPLFGNDPIWSYCKHGNLSTAIVWTEQVITRYSANRWYRLYIARTNDNGLTWEIDTKDEILRTTGAIAYAASVDMYCRCGTIYAMYGSRLLNNNQAHLYEVKRSTVEEIPLPDWIDLPILAEGGACVSSNHIEGETIRIAVNPNATSDYDVELANMLYDGQSNDVLYTNSGNYNILFQDGEMKTNQAEDDFYLCLGVNSNYMAFFDNPQLASSTRAFAWESATIIDAPAKPDIVIDQDYCMRGD